MRIGYARVSTRRQRLDLQLRALQDTGCDVIIAEKRSARCKLRPGLVAALAQCSSGDSFVVWRLDRVARDVFELAGIARLLHERGIRLDVLAGAGTAIDIETPEGRAMFAIHAGLAQHEADTLCRRANAGRHARADAPTKEMGRRRLMSVFRRSALVSIAKCDKRRSGIRE